MNQATTGDEEPSLSIDVFPEHTLDENTLDGKRLGFPRDLDVIVEAIAEHLAKEFRAKWTERVSITLVCSRY